LWSGVIAKVVDHFDIKVSFRQLMIAVDGNAATNNDALQQILYDRG